MKKKGGSPTSCIHLRYVLFSEAESPGHVGSDATPSPKGYLSAEQFEACLLDPRRMRVSASACRLSGGVRTAAASSGHLIWKTRRCAFKWARLDSRSCLRHNALGSLLDSDPK